MAALAYRPSVDAAGSCSYLSDGMRVSRARLNQARQALRFFYEDVLGKQTIPGGTAAA